MRFRPSLCLLGAVLPGLAAAGPSGLFLMPIADFLRHREAFAYAGVSGYERNVDRATYPFGAVTVGLFDRAEAGFDTDFRGAQSGNLKLNAFEKGSFGLSAGVTGWRGRNADPYVVGRYDGKGYRLHAGWWRTLGADRLALGSDFPAWGALSASVEFLSGPGSVAWATLNLAVPQVPGLSLGAAVGVPGARRDGLQYGAFAFYAFKF